MNFDESHWLEVIKRPNWYLEFNEFARHAQRDSKREQTELDELSRQIRHFFESALQKDMVNLAKAWPDTDKERAPIDTVVIHHTSAKPGYRLSYLNAVHLLNIYVPVFSKPPYAGKPIWSGHFKDNRQVFWGYHWLLRNGREFERLLDDNEIGWHAGNWDINKRSIGICLDDDYEKHNPTDETLQNLGRFIKTQYPQVKREKIIGHCEAKAGTICPGANFVSVWKSKLLEYL